MLWGSNVSIFCRISCDDGRILIDSPSKHVVISEKLDAVAKKLTFEPTTDFDGTIHPSCVGDGKLRND